MELFSTHTIDLFKIQDVNQWLKRRLAVPVFQTIFYYVFGLVRNRCQFPCRRIDFILRTYFVRPKTCYCQQQSSQYAIFKYRARDQSFIREARNETKYEKILDAADFAKSWELFLHKAQWCPLENFAQANQKNSKTTHTIYCSLFSK